MTALFISFLIGPPLIRKLRKKQRDGQPIREDGPPEHVLAKQGTPTMGGLLILIALFSTTLLWADLGNPYIWVTMLTCLAFAIIGFMDDALKLIRKNNYGGVSAKLRLVLEAITAGIAVWVLVHLSPSSLASTLALPFFKNLLLPLGLPLFMLFGIIVIIGCSNAVNLTDGLDGLAIVPVMVSVASFGIIAYLVGNALFADYLQLHHVEGVSELAVFCGALIGAGLGFLWFNAPPAMVFMGDTGSLALGAALGVMGVATKHEIVLAVIGGLFVLEAVSVIVQVVSFRLTGKRIFAMAPLHHHFEQKGWAEPTIVIRFWIISVVLALIGLSTLKLR